MQAGAKLVALAVVLAFASGIAVASMLGHGPLGYISYTVNGGGSGGGNITTVPVYIDLGNLTAGEGGSASGVASITVETSGYYELELVHESALKKVFSSFIVTIEVNGTTITLDLYGEDSAELYLAAGTYNATITVDYTVKENPVSQTVSDMLFLKISGDHNGDHDRGHDSGSSS